MSWFNTQLESLLIQDPGSLLIATLGWPAISISSLLSVVGVYFKKSRLLIIAAILILPVSLYLIGANIWIGKIFPLFPLLLMVCWYTVKHKLFFTSWSILISVFSGFSYLAYIVINH
jgi:hypothetical protein